MQHVWTFKWRVYSDGDFYEQDWIGKDLKSAKQRWRHFWNLTQSECCLFTVSYKGMHDANS